VKRTVSIPIVAAAVGVGVSILVAAGVLVVGVPGEWVWQRVGPVAWMAAVPAAVLGLGIALGSAALFRLRRRNVTAVLLLLVAGGFLLQLAVGQMSILPVSGEAAIVTIAPYIGGYFYQATKVEDAWEFVRDYAEWMRPIDLEDRVLGHLGDHPPGLVLFYLSLIRLMEAAPAAAGGANALASLAAPGGNDVARAAAGTELSEPLLAAVWLSTWLLRLAMALTVLPIYALARRVFGGNAALKCAVLFSFVPAFYVFSPSPDQLFVLVSVLIAYLTVKAWQEMEVWPAAAAGALFFVALNLTVGLVVLVALGVIAGGLSAWMRLKEGERRRVLISRLARTGGGAAGSFLFLLGACGLAGYGAGEVWIVSLQKHSEFGGLFQRTYWKWLLVNPLEFWAFLGIPAGAMLLWRIVSVIGKERLSGLRRDVPLLSFVALLLVLNFSGKNLGEVARLWMFLMPFAVLGAGKVLENVEIRMVAAMAGAQAVQVVAFKLALDIFSIDMLRQLMPD